MPNVKQILAVVVTVAVLAVGGSFISRAREGELRTAHDSLTIALRDGARSKAFAELLFERGQAAELRADSAERRADSLARVRRVAVARYDTARATAPDTCGPVIAAADSAIGAAQAEAEMARTGLRIAQEATKEYRAALDTLVPAYERLRAAAVAVDRSARPGFLERITPRFGVGAAAGFDPLSRRPAIVVGVTLGWHT